MRAKHMPALTSNGNSIGLLTRPRRRLRPSTQKEIDRNISANKNAVVAIKANAKIRKLRDIKLLEATKQILLSHADDLARAALIPALGATFVYKLDAVTKQNVMLTDPFEIRDALNLIVRGTPIDDATHNYFYITTKEPDIAAIEKIWNRMFGRPAEKSTLDVNVKTFSLIALARERRTLPEIMQAFTPTLLPEGESKGVSEVVPENK